MRRRGLRYYLLNYVPFYSKIDVWVKKQIMKEMKRRLRNRTYND